MCHCWVPSCLWSKKYIESGEPSSIELTNSWVKGCARNREQSTYQSKGNGNSKASNNCCDFYWIFTVFNIHRLPKNKIYTFQLQPTHNVFSSQGRKELKSFYIVIWMFVTCMERAPCSCLGWVRRKGREEKPKVAYWQDIAFLFFFLAPRDCYWRNRISWWWE